MLSTACGNLPCVSCSNSCLVRSRTSSSRKYASMSDLICVASSTETSLSLAAADTEVSAITRASSRLSRSTSAPRNHLPSLRKDSVVCLSSRRSVYGISCLSKTGLATSSVRADSDQTIATIVPARFNHASLIAVRCSKSIKNGLARLPSHQIETIEGEPKEQQCQSDKNRSVWFDGSEGADPRTAHSKCQQHKWAQAAYRCSDSRKYSGN